MPRKTSESGATAETLKPPAIDPPGVVLTGSTHGPSQPPKKATYGSARLREVLGLSRDAVIEQVCNDAAAKIEQLQRQRSTKGSS